ncbi:MAG: chorismate synthase [Candidatus Thermoplasmatota archaeon]|nr:chorismate synthase [Candidatus Thermoplasmatota archaeon]MEE3269889.1 chorismate synthase [Candidatus Thermoplasmatota archaeon]
MGMTLGDNLRVTLFGESHGACVGALVEGIPAGTPIDEDELNRAIASRRSGRKGMSTRSEQDNCELLSGVYDGKATGWPILMLTRNSDAKPSDYSFLPEQPRPGHADLVESIRSKGSNDPRGGGSHSARLTYGLVTAGSQVRSLLDEAGWKCHAHLHSVGGKVARPLFELDTDSPLESSTHMARLNCRDPEATIEMSELIESVRKDSDSIGSCVEILITGLPIGIGEPWFDGIEPALARGLMAIPGARAVEFSHGVKSSRMRGSEHNDNWIPGSDGPTLEGSESAKADGAIGGMSTGSPMSIIVHFKPPSSIPREQMTLHLPSNEVMPLKVGGRHDPVIGPRAVPVAEAVAMLVITDLGLTAGLLSQP